MAALNYAPSTRGPLGILYSAGAALRAIAAWALAGRDAARTRRVLLALNDRELADIGLSRCDIERLTQTGSLR